MISSDEAQNLNLKKPREGGQGIKVLLVKREEVSNNAMTGAMKHARESSS